MNNYMAEKKIPDLAEWVEKYTSDLYAWALHKISDEELAKDYEQGEEEQQGERYLKPGSDFGGECC